MPTPPDFTAGTALAAASLNKIGLWEITKTDFTNSSAVNVDSVFTSSFTHYRLLCEITNASVGMDIYLRLRAAGTTNANSNYLFAGYISYMGSVIHAGISSGGTTTQWTICSQDPTYNPNLPFSVEIMNPQTTYRTAMFSHGFTPVNPQPYFRHVGGVTSVTTSYDGFALVTTSGTISGTVTVYGYGKVA
jgi:hypothetical protein